MLIQHWRLLRRGGDKRLNVLAILPLDRCEPLGSGCAFLEFRRINDSDLHDCTPC